MWKNVRYLFVLVGLLALAALACGPGLPRVPDVTIPAGAVETVQSAGQQAAETAVALATQEGSSAVETIQAGGTIGLGALEDKFKTIQTDENGNFSLTITDAELNQAIQQAQEIPGSTNDSPLSQPVFSFTGGNIVLNANVTQPISAQLIVSFRPSVVNGVLQFEVVSATLGSVQVPTAVLSSADAMINSTLGQAMNNIPSNLTLQSIVMGEGTMTVSGTRK